MAAIAALRPHAGEGACATKSPASSGAFYSVLSDSQSDFSSKVRQGDNENTTQTVCSITAMSVQKSPTLSGAFLFSVLNRIKAVLKNVASVVRLGRTERRSRNVCIIHEDSEHRATQIWQAQPFLKQLLHHAAHAAHPTHITAATHRWAFFLRKFGNHAFGGQHQTGNRSCVL